MVLGQKAGTLYDGGRNQGEKTGRWEVDLMTFNIGRGLPHGLSDGRRVQVMSYMWAKQGRIWRFNTYDPWMT